MTESLAAVLDGKGSGVGDSSASAFGRLPMEEHPAWPMISHLPVMLAVSIPLRGFRVCDLLELSSGKAIESTWASTEDVPLSVGALHVCWGEFEVVEKRMALRLTRLA